MIKIKAKDALAGGSIYIDGWAHPIREVKVYQEEVWIFTNHFNKKFDLEEEIISIPKWKASKANSFIPFSF